MNMIKETLIQEAYSKYGKISPCKTKKSLENCFTIDDNIIYLWFITLDGSTHLVSHYN